MGSPAHQKPNDTKVICFQTIAIAMIARPSYLRGATRIEAKMSHSQLQMQHVTLIGREVDGVKKYVTLRSHLESNVLLSQSPSNLPSH